MSKTEHKFEADTGKVLNIVINSLYSNKDIFLRELISNASDACDKRRYRSLTNKSYVSSDELNIFISINKKASTISIQDNGIGMDKNIQKLIFEKFYREQNGNIHDIKGHGLGLSYVKKIIDFHNGKIALESKKGVGTKFYITLKNI